MRFLRRTLCALPTLVAAALIERPKEDGQIHHKVPVKAPILELGLSQEQPQAQFTVPCPGCQDDEEDDAFLFNFQAFPAADPCGVSNITLNGSPLLQAWDGVNYASGFGSIVSLPRTKLSKSHDLGLSWETHCLEDATLDNKTAAWYDAAQLLTVTIRTIDGRPVSEASGFTISYKSSVPLELLRLSTKPVPTASETSSVQAWQNPPAHLRLSPPSTNLDSEISTEKSSLEAHLAQLRGLQIEVARLEDLIEKERQLVQQHEQFASAVPDDDVLPACHSLRCYLRTLLDDATDLVLDTVYMRYHPGSSSRTFHGHHAQEVASDSSSTSFASTTSEQASTNDSQSSRQHLFDSEPRRVNALALTLEIVGAVTCITCLFIAIRRTCCSARANAERRAACAERRNEREYRKAVRIHRFKSWWSGLGRRSKRDAHRITDYEEKRCLIQDQESLLENAMQDEIRMLRAAHNAVNSIVASSAGSSASRSPRPTRAQPYAPPSRIHTEWQNVPLGRNRSDSLPTYRSEDESSQYSSDPPGYSSDEGESDVIANGMRFTPDSSTFRAGYSPPVSPTSPTSSGTRRWTPQSSILEVSPRPSQETIRSDSTGRSEWVNP